MGCVHTVQGRDFRYVGVLLGDDIDVGNGIINANDEIKNSYFILLTRGMHGHGLYTSNLNLKKYIQRYIKRKMVKKVK